MTKVTPLFFSLQIPRQEWSNNRSKIDPIHSKELIREDVIAKMNSFMVVTDSII